MYYPARQPTLPNELFMVRDVPIGRGIQMAVICANLRIAQFWRGRYGQFLPAIGAWVPIADSKGSDGAGFG